LNAVLRETLSPSFDVVEIMFRPEPEMLVPAAN
jgi:hypothetical protein